MTDKIHKILSRKNIYSVAFIVVLLLIIGYAVFPKHQVNISKFIFNPFWPIALGMFELFIQSYEKEVARKNENKINSTAGVLRTIGRTQEKFKQNTKLLLEALSGDDLIEKEKNDQDMKEMEEKLEKAGKLKVSKVSNLKDF
ncbi:hypothetical protein ACFL22_01220 [Patescibacteria group bacterium]